MTYEQFTACVMAAGYNECKSRANVSIDWIAYQGAPVGGVTGEVRMSQWWTGTTCETVSFPSVSQCIFFKTPTYYYYDDDYDDYDDSRYHYHYPYRLLLRSS